MHAAMIEAVPAGALAALAEAIEECLAAVRVEHVVLARDEEHRQRQLLEHLLGVVEFLVAGELRHVAGVDDEIGLVGQRLHLGDRLAKGRARVGVRRLVEPDVAVAQLDEACVYSRALEIYCCAYSPLPARDGSGVDGEAEGSMPSAEPFAMARLRAPTPSPSLAGRGIAAIPLSGGE